MADIDVGSPRKAARVIIVVFALSFISSSYVADRLLWHSSLESIRTGLLLLKSGIRSQTKVERS